MFEFHYKEDGRVYFVGSSNVYDDEQSTIDYEGYMELANIVYLHDQLELLLKNNGFLRWLFKVMFVIYHKLW